MRLGVVLLGVTLSLDAGAQGAPPTGDVAAARDAYDRGAASYDAGEFALAALQLSKADAIVPNDVALELALRASLKANDALLAMDLAARADGRRSAALAAARDEARSKLASRVGRVTVVCPAGTACSATLDEAPFPVGEPRWVLVGSHRVVVDGGNGQRQAFQVRVDPGATVPVEAASSPPGLLPPPSPPPRDMGDGSGGMSPAWFWAGLGLSAALGGATIASAIDTQAKHDAFKSEPSLARSNDGVDAQLRTNLLFAGTAAAAVASGVVGLLFVRWSSSPQRSAR
jgi:hypothetical protein